MCRLSRDTPVSQALHLSIDAYTGTPPASDWKRSPGRPRRTWLQQVEEDISACQFATPWTARCGDHYDPQPVKRSSEWVSECAPFYSIPFPVIPYLLSQTLSLPFPILSLSLLKPFPSLLRPFLSLILFPLSFTPFPYPFPIYSLSHCLNFILFVLLHFVLFAFNGLCLVCVSVFFLFFFVFSPDISSVNQREPLYSLIVLMCH